MIQYISKPFKYFFKLESASGLVLLFAAVIALFVSNSSLGENYFKILESYFTLGTEDFGLKLSVLHWINDVFEFPLIDLLKKLENGKKDDDSMNQYTPQCFAHPSPRKKSLPLAKKRLGGAPNPKKRLPAKTRGGDRPPCLL